MAGRRLFDGRPGKPLLRLVSGVVAAVLRRSPPLSVTRLPEANWVAKSLEGLAPVRAGRFVVHGGHDREPCARTRSPSRSRPDRRFGTGHHGTTAGCLVEIDRVAGSAPIRNALDLGTGSGVLAIAIAKAAKARVVASDIDPLAAKIANENARLNGVGRLVTTIAAAGLGEERDPRPRSLRSDRGQYSGRAAGGAGAVDPAVAGAGWDAYPVRPPAGAAAADRRRLSRAGPPAQAADGARRLADARLRAPAQKG